MTSAPLSTEQLLASFEAAKLPWSEDAELACVATVCQHPDLLEQCPPIDAFFHIHNRQILTIVHKLYGESKPVTLPSITHEAREMGILDKVGGPYLIGRLFTEIQVPKFFPHYASIVREKYQLRAMIGAMASGISDLLRFNGAEGVSAADTIQNVLKDVNETVNDDGSEEIECTPISELVMQVLEESQTMAESGKKIPGISTGISALDAIFGGMEEGCLTVVSAESSDGKSSLCRQFLEAAADEGHCVMDFTYEMTPRAEIRRALCSQGRIDAKNLKMGLLTRGEQMALVAQAKKISAWDMHVIDAAGKSIERICRHIARKAKKLPKGKKLVALIDYIQLCKTDAKTPNREREVAHITSTAKICAKMTGAHILMPSQQNKDGDVRESMAVEQDADTLIQIQKVEAKSNGKPWQKDKPKDEPNNIRRIFFKKLRDGERYTSVMMELVGRFFRFEVVKKEE